MSDSKLRAGAARVEITPKPGTHLSGDVGRYRPAERVREPLYVKVLVLERDGRRLGLVSMDLTILAQPYTDRLRAAARELGFEPGALMVHVVQNHSAPSVGDFMVDPDFPGIPADLEWLRGGDTAYSEFAMAQALAALRQACAALRPARLAAGSAVKDGLAFNRRGVMRNGRIGMPWLFRDADKPLGPTEYRFIEGPIDPEVGVVAVQDLAGAFIALVLHYTCHPVCVFATGNMDISSDWPGAWESEMQAHAGPGCVALTLNGCCGNINPWPAFTPDFVPDYQRMGHELAISAQRVLASGLNYQDVDSLDWRRNVISLPLREVPAPLLAEARAVLAEHPQPWWDEHDARRVRWEWTRAASVVSIEYLREREHNVLPYEVQAFRLGDVALVGLPGEPFVEGQLRLKIESPAAQTYVGHCCTQYIGYLAIPEAFPRGGHEASPCYWAKVGPAALGMVVDDAVKQVNSLFRVRP